MQSLKEAQQENESPATVNEHYRGEPCWKFDATQRDGLEMLEKNQRVTRCNTHVT